MKSIDVQISGPNALRVENEREDISAGGYGSISHDTDDAHRVRVGRIFGSGFTEELPRSAALDLSPFDYDIGNPVLISQNAVK